MTESKDQQRMHFKLFRQDEEKKWAGVRERTFSR